jgi:transcriptional regulator with XRE-family HTH domain
MATTLAQRIFVAHLEISYRLGRKVTLEELGRLVAKQMGRRAPFSAAAVSRWEAGTQTPTPDVIEAIAAVSGTDPGWISHGEKSAAPTPRSRPALAVPEPGAPRAAARARARGARAAAQPERMKIRRRRRG